MGPRTTFRRTATSAAVAAVLALLVGGCSDGDADGSGDGSTSTTAEPASQFGSSMGVESGDVADVAALGDGPAAGDTWQVPVGLSICGRFIDVPAGAEVNGVTAGPSSAAVVGTGEEAPTLGDFAESAGIGLGAGRLTLPTEVVPPELDNVDPPLDIAGATLATGQQCGDIDAEVQVWVYSEDARASGDGILVVTQDVANVPFSQPGMAMVVAFAPESSLPTLPPSAFGD